MCADSGALTIQKWVQNKNAHFVCEELASSSIPFLLFNFKFWNSSRNFYSFKKPRKAVERFTTVPTSNTPKTARRYTKMSKALKQTSTSSRKNCYSINILIFAFLKIRYKPD